MWSIYLDDITANNPRACFRPGKNQLIIYGPEYRPVYADVIAHGPAYILEPQAHYSMYIRP